MKRLLVQAIENEPHPGTDGTENRLTGKVVAIHANDNPNGGAVLLRHDDPPMEVYDTTTIRRAIRDKDLRVVAAPKAAGDVFEPMPKRTEQPFPTRTK